MKKLLLSLTALMPFSAYGAIKKYAVDHRISLDGTQGWDCLAVDSSRDRLFVTRGDHVDVVDLKTEKVIGKIAAGVAGAHAVAFVPELKKGYITSGKLAKVVVFDLDTLKVLKDIPSGKKPDLLVYDSLVEKMFVFNADDPSISVIDTKSDSVLKTIPLTGKPEFAVSNRGEIYFNSEDTNSLVHVDGRSMTIKETWALKGCEEPSGLSGNFETNQLFSVCSNNVMVVSDARTGALIKTLPIGKGPDGSEFDAGETFSSNGDGTLTVVRKGSSGRLEVAENLVTQKGARTMTVDRKSHTIYLLAAKYEPQNAANERPKIIPGSVEVLVVKKL